MNSFGNRLYDPLKDRRYGMLFLITVVIFICLYILGLWASLILDFERSEWQMYFLHASPGVVMLAGALIWRKVRRAQPSKENFRCLELSRDEILKARSKLLKTKKLK